MSKEGEINYLKNLGAEGQVHAKNKPFSDVNCSMYLIHLGNIMSSLGCPACPDSRFGSWHWLDERFLG